MSWGSFAIGVAVGAIVVAPVGIWVGFVVMAGVAIDSFQRGFKR